MLDKFHSYIDDHLANDQTCRVRSADSEECQAFMLGQLMRASQSMGGWPASAISKLDSFNAASLSIKLKDIDLKTYRSRKSSIDHEQCNIGHKMAKEIVELFHSDPLVVLESHRIHLRERWKKGNADAALD